jgi:hypothetical protein
VFSFRDPIFHEQPGLLQVAREKMRTRHLAYRTEQAYLRVHQSHHPRDLGAVDVEQFLTHLAVERKVSASTQNQALQALLFLCRTVLGEDFPWLENATCIGPACSSPIELAAGAPPTHGAESPARRVGACRSGE